MERKKSVHNGSEKESGEDCCQDFTCQQAKV